VLLLPCICSLTDVALCSKEPHLSSSAEILQTLKQRRHDCLLLDAIDRYRSAVQLTAPTASTHKSHVTVSTFAVTVLCSSGLYNQLR